MCTEIGDLPVSVMYDTTMILVPHSNIRDFFTSYLTFFLIALTLFLFLHLLVSPLQNITSLVLRNLRRATLYIVKVQSLSYHKGKERESSEAVHYFTTEGFTNPVSAYKAPGKSGITEREEGAVWENSSCRSCGIRFPCGEKGAFFSDWR